MQLNLEAEYEVEILRQGLLALRDPDGLSIEVSSFNSLDHMNAILDLLSRLSALQDEQDEMEIAQQGFLSQESAERRAIRHEDEV